MKSKQTHKQTHPTRKRLFEVDLNGNWEEVFLLSEAAVRDVYGSVIYHSSFISYRLQLNIVQRVNAYSG